MKNLRYVLVCSAGLLLSSSALRADSITASLFSAPSGMTPIDLTGVSSTPSQATINGSGYTISFAVDANQGVVQGAAGGLYAVPVAGVSGGNPEYYGAGGVLTTNVADSAQYLSTGLGTITIDFDAPENQFALLWGSIDTGNLLTLSNGYSVTGADVQNAASGFVSNGYQGPGGSAYVVVDTSSFFTSVTLSSSVVSFESADFSASNTTLAPEPERLTLMGTGLAAISATLFRRSRRS